MPEELLSVYAGFLRVMVGLSMNAVFRAGRMSPPPAQRPLFLLDECAALGYLEPLEKGMGYLRAYGRAILIFQDVHQLESIYSRAKSIVANSAVRVAFAVNDEATAKMLSNQLGQTTVTSRSIGISQASDAFIRHNAQAGFAEAGRPLLDPSEILRLPRDQVLVFITGSSRSAILATRLVYLKSGISGVFGTAGAAAPPTPRCLQAPLLLPVLLHPLRKTPLHFQPLRLLQRRPRSQPRCDELGLAYQTQPVKAVGERQAVECTFAGVELLRLLFRLFGHLPCRHTLPPQFPLLNPGQAIAVKRGVSLRLAGIGPQNLPVLLNPRLALLPFRRLLLTPFPL